MNLPSFFSDRVKCCLRPCWLALKHYWTALVEFANWLNLQSKISTVRFRRLFIAASIPAEAEGRLNLHLGCGNIYNRKFINIDGYPFPHVDYVQSIDKLSQFNEGSVDLIYASHCLEHFSYLKTKAVLGEWFRVLKKGAVLRLSVPDFDKLIEIYATHNCDPNVILPQLMGGQNNKYNYHLTVLNRVNLSALLQGVGFSEIRSWRPGTDDLTTFDDFSVYQKCILGNKYEISLNIEATK